MMLDGRIRTAKRSRALPCWRDPAGRFQLRYPRGWALHAEDVVQVTSPGVDGFARVDTLPPSPWLWNDIERAFVLAGIRLEIGASDERGASGALQIASRRFRWEAHAHRVPGGTLVLSLAAPEGREEPAILRTIRRRFRVTARAAPAAPNRG